MADGVEWMHLPRCPSLRFRAGRASKQPSAPERLFVNNCETKGVPVRGTDKLRAPEAVNPFQLQRRLELARGEPQLS